MLHSVQELCLDSILHLVRVGLNGSYSSSLINLHPLRVNCQPEIFGKPLIFVYILCLKEHGAKCRTLCQEIHVFLLGLGGCDALGWREWRRGRGRGREREGNYIDCVLFWSLPGNFTQDCTGASMHKQSYRYLNVLYIEHYSFSIAHNVSQLLTLAPTPRALASFPYPSECLGTRLNICLPATVSIAPS